MPMCSVALAGVASRAGISMDHLAQLHVASTIPISTAARLSQAGTTDRPHPDASTISGDLQSVSGGPEAVWINEPPETPLATTAI